MAITLDVTETSTAQPPSPPAGTRKTTLEGRELVWAGGRYRPTVRQVACDVDHHLVYALQCLADFREDIREDGYAAAGEQREVSDLAAIEAAVDGAWLMNVSHYSGEPLRRGDYIEAAEALVAAARYWLQRGWVDQLEDSAQAAALRSALGLLVDAQQTLYEAQGTSADPCGLRLAAHISGPRVA